MEIQCISSFKGAPRRTFFLIHLYTEKYLFQDRLAGESGRRPFSCPEQKPVLLMTQLTSKVCPPRGIVHEFCMESRSFAKSLFGGAQVFQDFHM